MASTRVEGEAPPLPKGFTSVQDILDGKIPLRATASVFGVVTDFRTPIPTRGHHWKCQIRVYDHSIQWDTELALLLNVFRPENEMPDVGLGDVIAIIDVKVQRYRDDSISLLTSFATQIVPFRASKIPRPPADGVVALDASDKAAKKVGKTETLFVPIFYHTLDKERIPAPLEFETMKIQSVNVKDKFSLLEGVKDGKFADMVVQFVRAPYDLGDKMTLWVSDYTENPAFFNHSMPITNSATDGQDGDPFGYCSKFTKTTAKLPDWTGPYGKRSLQVTCYEPHASVIREHKLHLGAWVRMKNVQIKYGNNATSLEGFLREDRGSLGIKINLCPLDPGEDAENISPELKDAIRRKRDYEKLKKEQKRSLGEAGRAGQKRKAALEEAAGDDLPTKMNAKTRRKLQRAQAAKKEEQDKLAPELVPDLNKSIKCEHTNYATSSLSEIKSPPFYDTIDGANTIPVQLPFVNVNYRTIVRVVNFFPPRLQDFACVKSKSSEYDILSDHEESDDSEGEAETRSQAGPDAEWEWRFFLELEDVVVGNKRSPSRVWAFVDNQAAQCLMNLDASDLQKDHESLSALRQQLFLLLGDLEETKRREEVKRVKQRHKDCAPPDSSDEEGNNDGKRSGGKYESTNADGDEGRPTNMPFSCCIRQYGVKVPEPDASLATAGNGKRWETVYGLFGARISGA